MSEIRLNKLVKKYNIGLQDLVDFLSKEGVEVELNPNAKVEETPELLAALGRTFGKDLQDKQAAEEVDIKLSKILENTAKKAKDVLAIDPADIAKRADLDDETVEDVIGILKAEFED